MFSVAQGAHRGRPVAAAPCTPGLWPPKSPLRGSFDLSRQASGRAEAASVQNTALSPHPCGLPRPSGNVSAILRPPTPAVATNMGNKLKAGCTDRRPDKRSAIRHCLMTLRWRRMTLSVAFLRRDGRGGIPIFFGDHHRAFRLHDKIGRHNLYAKFVKYIDNAAVQRVAPLRQRRFR